MKKIATLFLVVLLSFLLFSCKSNQKSADNITTEPQQSPVSGKDASASKSDTPVSENDASVSEYDVDDDVDPSVSFDSLSSLKEGVAAGIISKDDYVACTLLRAFTGNEVPEAYRDETFAISDIRPYIQDALDDWDDLSEETQKSVLEALTLCNIEFADAEKTGSSMVNTLADALLEKVYAQTDKVYALTDKVVIDQALLSKSGKFVIWYSDSDPNSAGCDKAQLVADTLDEAVKAYDSFFGVKYRFVSEFTYPGSITYARQGKILQKNGIDPSCLETCMNVYLSDFSNNSVKAICLCGFDEIGLFDKLLIPAAAAVWGENGLYGVRTFPFIAVDADSPFDTQMKQVIYHELFHYYQKHVLRDEPYCCDIIGGESSANWAAALKEPNIDNRNGFGDWADLWTTHCADWLAYAGDSAGYGLYPMLINYQLDIENGKQKIVDALFETDFLKSLEDNSTVEERKEMMRNLAKHTFANDNVKPVLNAKKPRVNTYNLSAVTPVSNAAADPLSIRYYQVNETVGDSTKLSFDTASDEITALVIAKLSDGTVREMKKITTLSEVVTLFPVENLDHYFVAVCNGSFTTSGSYNISVGDYAVQQGVDVLRFEKTVVVDNDDFTITALGGVADGRWIDLNCEYQSKSSSTLYLKDDYCILNGYTLEFLIDGAPWDGMEMAPHSSGKLTLNVDGSSIDRRSYDHTVPSITIKDEYCIDGGFDLTLCFEVSHVYGEESSADYMVNGSRIQIDGGASTLPESIIELYTQMDTEQLAKRNLNRILLYQPMNKPIEGGVTIIASAVAEYNDGTHVIMFETENTSGNDLHWSDVFIGISGVNGVAVSHVYGTDNGMKAHTKGLCYIDAFPFSNEDRKVMYGFSSIGSYDIFAHLNRLDGLEGYTLSFGEESACNVGQLLYEDDYCCWHYVGAGPTIIHASVLDEVLLVLKKEEKNDLLHPYNIREVYADGVLAEKYIFGEDCIRNGAFYEIELDDVDPTVDHELKIVTQNGYGIVVDEIVIPYKGQAIKD